MAFKIEVWGGHACFTRPEMKVERVSYDVMTPSAARGLLEAIYWHPGLRWRVEKIHVMAPIRFAHIRRNEVKSKISARTVRTVAGGGQADLSIVTGEDIVQRAAMVLRDVRYVIEARFDLVPERMKDGDNEGKFCDIIKRRLERGQCYHQPCFGTREFPAHFRRWPGGDISTAYTDERELGFMLYDMDYSDPENIMPVFFRAKLIQGVLDVRDCEVFR